MTMFVKLLTFLKVNCYAWNVNGVTTSEAKITVISEDDTNANPSISSSGKGDSFITLTSNSTISSTAIDKFSVGL